MLKRRNAEHSMLRNVKKGRHEIVSYPLIRRKYKQKLNPLWLRRLFKATNNKSEQFDLRS